MAKPMPIHNPKWTKGWVPASVDIPDSSIVEGATPVAERLPERFEGKPISGSAIARVLDHDVQPVRSWLAQPETMGLVSHPEARRGWIVVSS
ncbi:hypothetical protein [Rosistilla oblonga]|uniref:hypothetical protein n=1 Tax=Rosistilla oblonga TaxID=2527990 RepID=UPI003A987BA6